MSNATYNALWAEAIGELTEQVHLEDPSLMDGAEAPDPVGLVFFLLLQY